jgi:hypothetical protein
VKKPVYAASRSVSGHLSSEWSDAAPEVHRGFELERLCTKRAVYRLNFLQNCDPARLRAARNLSDLSRLTYDGFTDDDDRSAACEIPQYDAIQTEIAGLAGTAPFAIDGPVAALERDPEWRQLREEIHRKLKSIEARVRK